jgi:hypothetical protein
MTGLYCFGQRHEYVAFDSFRIDGVLKFMTSKSSLVKFLGPKSAIKNIVPECDHEVDYTNGVKFYTYSNNGVVYLVYNNQAEFWELDLAKNPQRFLLYKQHKLSKTTTRAELKAMFPKAFQEFLKEKSKILRLRLGAAFDDELQLEIRSGKVSKVYYWTPC